jgi:tetratricopeptide (TPR) repeat protein
MPKGTSILVFSVFLFCPVSVWAQGSTTRDMAGPTVGQQQLYSSPVSKEFYEIAYDLANSKDATGPQVEQAMAFLTAALSLDNDAKDVRELLIEFACRETGWNYSDLVYSLLVNYIDESADLEVAGNAVEYILEKQNSRERREKLLEQMLGILGSKNKILGSELATKLGIVKAENADMEGAEHYFMEAYKNNRYNWKAFAKLAEIRPERIGPALHLERLRLAVRENPSDIDVAIAFAQETEHLMLYEISAATYKYCADLFSYLYPSESLPARIYLPWAINSYNSKQNMSQCLEIAKRVRQEGGFDLRIESIAGKTALKMGDTDLATLIFQAIEEKTQRLIKLRGSSANTALSNSSGDEFSEQDYNKQLAWFYSLVLPVPDKALNWANKAFAAEPNSPVTAAILAYALTMNNQIEWAKPLVDHFGKTQIADLTQAMIQLAEGQNDRAVEFLRAAIAKDPGSFAAECAKELLAQQGKEYVQPADVNTVLSALQNVFGQTLIPVFMPPEQMISARLQIQGSVFQYGSDISGIAVITNHSSEPLIISDYSLFKGNIRVDAVISGDLSKSIPKLVLKRIGEVLQIEPGRSINVPLRLMTGEFRKTLIMYPQASLDIEFILYLDPVIANDGKVTNRLVNIQPSRLSIKRPGIELTGKSIRNEFNSISTASINQKIKIAELFTGLLKEQYAMSNCTPPYRFLYADWMNSLLRSALSHKSGLLLNPADDEWVVKVYTMADMLSLPMDHELISAVAENMNSTKWPVRLMAVYLLSTIPDSQFGQVLDWTAKNDPNKNVRDIAVVLGRKQ